MIELALETTKRMNGSNKSRDYCREMICGEMAGDVAIYPVRQFATGDGTRYAFVLSPDIQVRIRNNWRREAGVIDDGTLIGRHVNLA